MISVMKSYPHMIIFVQRYSSYNQVFIIMSLLYNVLFHNIINTYAVTPVDWYLQINYIVCVSVLNVAIVWPNFYLHKIKSMPLIIEAHSIPVVINNVGGYATNPTGIIPPSSYWLFWTISQCTIR